MKKTIGNSGVVAAAGGVSGLTVIDNNIKYIRTAGKNVQDRIQATAVAIIEHAAAHGDCDRALRLVRAMPKGQRRSLVVRFFAMFSPIAVNIDSKNEAKSTVRLRKQDSKAYTPFNAAGAKAVSWYTIEPERMPDMDWDLEKLNAKVTSIAEMIERKLKEGHVTAEARERANTLIERLKAA